MDTHIAAAARALAHGDPLAALQYVALRDDAPALALRGNAMAQLGDYARARSLLRRAAQQFGRKDVLARARCVAAEAEVALAARDLSFPQRALDAAAHTLALHRDFENAAHTRLIAVRRMLLLGELDRAERALAAFDLRRAGVRVTAMRELVAAGIALRRVHTRRARAALQRASSAARAAAIPALAAEIATAQRLLEAPASRLVQHGQLRPLRLDEVETLFASRLLIVDACRRRVREAAQGTDLSRRPLLFALLQMLAEAWPADVSRAELIARLFGPTRDHEAQRTKLRVEVGRLRKALGSLASVHATAGGFTLQPHAEGGVAVLLPPIDGEDAALLALLADGESWSTSSLARALGSSQRTVQRALTQLEAKGRVQSRGRARARRWHSPPVVGFATTLLLSTAPTPE